VLAGGVKFQHWAYILQTYGFNNVYPLSYITVGH